MPDLDRTLLQALIAFAMVAMLALVLRWTFGRGAAPGAHRAGGSRGPDDFGLLAPVAVLDSPEQADRLRARLAEAGIRATTTRGSDGRHRVLVFSDELDRARRVGGWSA